MSVLSCGFQGAVCGIPLLEVNGIRVIYSVPMEVVMRVFLLMLMLAAAPAWAQVSDFRQLGGVVSEHVNENTPGWRIYGIEVLDQEVMANGTVFQFFRAVFEATEVRYVFPPLISDEFAFVERRVDVGEQREVMGAVETRQSNDGVQTIVRLDDGAVLFGGMIRAEVEALGEGNLVVVENGSEEATQARTILSVRETGVMPDETMAPSSEGESSLTQTRRAEMAAREARRAAIEQRFGQPWRGRMVCASGVISDIMIDMRLVRDEEVLFSRIEYSPYDVASKGIAEARLLVNEALDQVSSSGTIYPSQPAGVNFEFVTLTYDEGVLAGSVNVSECEMVLETEDAFNARLLMERTTVLAILDRIVDTPSVLIGLDDVPARITQRTPDGIEGDLMLEQPVPFSLSFPAGADSPVFRIDPFPMPAPGYAACVDGFDLSIDMMEGVITLASDEPGCVPFVLRLW